MSAREQRRRNQEEALRLCAMQGHHMGYWITRSDSSYCVCRDCGATAVVTRDGIKERPPTANRGSGGGAPFFPCPRNGDPH